jgi:hypothetical protein
MRRIACGSNRTNPSDTSPISDMPMHPYDGSNSDQLSDANPLGSRCGSVSVPVTIAVLQTTENVTASGVINFKDANSSDRPVVIDLFPEFTFRASGHVVSTRVSHVLAVEGFRTLMADKSDNKFVSIWI